MRNAHIVSSSDYSGLEINTKWEHKTNFRIGKNKTTFAYQVANLYLRTTNEPDLPTDNKELDHSNKRRIVTELCRLTGYVKQAFWVTPNK